MVRLLFAILMSLALGSSAFADGVPCENCYIFEHGVHRKIIPTNSLVCFWFIQPRPGKVLLELYLRDGQARPYTKFAGKVGHICVGRSWVKQMTTRSFICNDVNHFDYGWPIMIKALLVKSAYSKNVAACLYGRDRCREMGYPAYN